jgi:predicted HD phosphohydrolase
MTRDELIDFLVGLADVPSDDIEGMSALDHGLQCAFELARIRPADGELQLAGLVHDIGHEFGPDEQHGRLGADQVRDALGDRIAALVEAHVPAKRYLVGSDQTYLSALSATSVHTLRLQGGALSPEEAEAFASSPYAADAIVLRKADDAAKVLGRVVPPLEHWTPRFGRTSHHS